MALGRRPLEIVAKGTYPLLAKADHWKRVTLSDVANVQNGFAFKSSYFDHDRGVPLIRIRDISKEETEHRYWGEFDDQYLVKTGEILIGMDGDFAVSRWAGEKALLNQRVCKVTLTSDQFDEGFLCLCLQPFLDAINAETSSVTVKHLSSKTIEEIPLPLPPLVEQCRIVAKIEELFSELDKGIESLKTAQAQLKVYRQSVLKHAFEGKLTAQWREENKDKLETPEQLLARIKQEQSARYGQKIEEWKAAVKEWEVMGKQGQKPRKPKIRPALCLPSEAEIANLPLLPNGWLWIKVQTLLTEPPTNGHSVKDRASGFPVLRLTAIKKEKLDLSETKNGDWEREDALPYLVRQGDFLLARGNGSKQLVGRGGLVPALEHDLAYPDTMIRLRVDPFAIRESFFSYVWNSRLLRQQIEGAARTTAGIYKINQGHILNFIVPLCSLTEQAIVVKRLSAALSAIDGIETQVNKHLGKADTLRQSILKKAFAGHLVPPDPHDEPASVLLDRIKAEREKVVKNNPPKKTKKRTEC